MFKRAVLLLVVVAYAAPVKAQDGWQTIASWEGQGMQSTESFEVPDREWRILWVTADGPAPASGIFQIFVYRDPTDEMVSLAANQIGPGSAATMVRGQPGARYYLEINSANIGWKVEVQVRGGG